MRIANDHLYHGAALIQIAENPRFTAINSLTVKGTVLRSAYRINDDIGVFLKYATHPKPSFGEYVFNFDLGRCSELEQIQQVTDRLFLALVCVDVREICCLAYGEFTGLIEARRRARQTPEDQYTILVTAEKNRQLRVYMNAPGRKKRMLGQPLMIKRAAFPDRIFEG